MFNPKISIITVCFNAVRSIEKTILSVINQTYNNIEYVIIDGSSTDGTIDIIRKYENRISYWKSEPDMGIYDAMNKGIMKITGDFVNFMNAGDTFFSDTVISELVPQIQKNSIILYGDTMCVYSIGEKILKPNSLELMRKCMFFNHQSSFAETKTMKSMLFDTSFKLCADYKFHYDLYMKGLKFQYIPLIIARYDAQNGVSSKQIPMMYKEYGRIQGKTNSLIWIFLYQYKIALYKLKSFIKIFVPDIILKRKNRIK